MKLRLFLDSTENTLELGALLATMFRTVDICPALLLNGGLGSGKTTLVRGLVSALPGSEQADVSSPSFNIFNVYPTTPQVAHFDLYRLEGMPPDESLFEFLSDETTLTIIEWIEYLDRKHWPEQAICLEWTDLRQGRSLDIYTIGSKARPMLESHAPLLRKYTMESDLT
jgi:tRNA threonylcarbamoyladenosine biosynthesis protein TsaE